MIIRFFTLFLFAGNISFGQSNIDKALFEEAENLKSDTADNSMNTSFNKRTSLEEINNPNAKIDICLYTLHS